QEILRRHPDDNVSLMNLGNLYFGYLDRLDDAIDCVEKSIKENDREPMAYAVCGEIYFARGCERIDAGKREEANADFLRAIEKYTQYIVRAGLRDPENYRHIQDRKDKCERAIRLGERPEPKAADGFNNPFQRGTLQNQKRGPRWKPGSAGTQ